jgi:proline racemase
MSVEPQATTLELPTGTVAIEVVDSHTGGEPTRVVVGGFPPLTATSIAERAAEIAEHHRALARALVDEPRGNEAMVGALLVDPVDPHCQAGVIFFDRHLVLGMCGHGTIGVVATLRALGRIGPGVHRLETPAGVVTAVLGDDGRVGVENVPSRRLVSAHQVEVPGLGPVRGDIAYGGNTFFLVGEPTIDLDRDRAELVELSTRILRAVHDSGHAEVDHVELFGPPRAPEAASRNFVLCPSGTYDRSPCGTGTSAKVAVLAVEGGLDEGDTWVQESITGSTFEATFRWHDRAAGVVVPRIVGSATITGHATLFFDGAGQGNG